MKWMKVGLPIVVLTVGLIGAAALKFSKEDPETRPPELVLSIVRVLPVVAQDVQMTVSSQGTVGPKTESDLVPEVSGRVIEVSSSFSPGGFFEEDEVLLRVDSHDYRQLVIVAHARLAQANLHLKREQTEAELARREWDEIGEGEPTPLTMHEPQIDDARAAVAAAQAGVERAQRDLDRTAVRAPYAGRLRSKSADIGEFVTRGIPVAQIYSVDYVEVRLPLPNSDMAFLDLPLDFRGERSSGGPKVILRAKFAGTTHEWSGNIVRTEAEIDPRTRMVHVVAQVAAPYDRKSHPGRPPLAVGLFVEAEIEGRVVKQVSVIPRTALRNGNTVVVVDPGDRIRIRRVEVLRVSDAEAVVTSGFEAGDRLCMSSLSRLTDGTQVRTIEFEARQ